jgi:hypothetical protein
VTATREKPVSTFLIVTCTPGSTAAEVSSADPVKVAVV